MQLCRSGGEVRVDLRLKRTFEIENGQLLDYITGVLPDPAE